VVKFKVAIALPFVFAFACGKLVGIEDTEVTTGGTAGSAATSSGGSSGTSTGGSSVQGGAKTTGGASSTSSGASAGGLSAQGGVSTGGASISGGDAGSGGADAGEGSGGDGGMSTGGTGTGGTGTGGTGTGGTATAGANNAGSAGAGGCTTGSRCAATGRETCTGGQWKSDPCPLNRPACEAMGQCVVRGPTMVAVGSFYVDSTEVTVAHYKAFLTAKGNDTSNQSSVCSWNTNYYDPVQAMSPDTWPISYVDWCDAAAFCKWAGKRLCGKVGGGAIPQAQLFEQNSSQWYLACGGTGGGTHPNGNSVCNSNNGNGTLAPVASFPGCEGNYPGLFDLEGNAAEWVDSCSSTAGANDTCSLMGGSFFDSKSYCTEVYDDRLRSDTAVSFGFRCCSG
jgi:hypothetical protein